jgi:branched-chain amino acid transport system permease protein
VIHLLEQLLNGLQFGVMLFLMAAGLTLIFGIMNVINLAHGALYMVGAYVAAATFAATGSFLLGVAAALAAAALLGVALELVLFRTLYTRDHLDQVLATFGLILFSTNWCGSSGARPRSICASRIFSAAGSRSCPAAPIRCIGWRS